MIKHICLKQEVILASRKYSVHTHHIKSTVDLIYYTQAPPSRRISPQHLKCTVVYTLEHP